MPKIVNEGRRVINNIKSSSALYIMKTLLTLILAVTCICVKEEYFFETSNMLMFEMFISALPSFVMSLQPNTARVKGKFIPYVLSRALPGALTMGIAIMTLYILSRTPLGNDFALVNELGKTEHYQAMMMIVLTFSGLVMLYRICQPFNLLRGVLFIVSTGLCLVVLLIKPIGDALVLDGWKTLDFTLSQMLIIIIVIQASFPISGFLIRAFDMINIAEDTPEENR